MKTLFPLTVTDRVGEAAAFYRELFAMTVLVDIGWYIQLSHPDRPEAQVAFIEEGHDSIPRSHRSRPGGVVITLEAKRALMTGATVTPEQIETWSQTTFALLAEVAESSGCCPTGESGSLFASDFFEAGRGEVVAYVVVAADHPVTAKQCSVGIIGGRHYAGAIHCGPYGDLDRTYGAIGGYVAEHFTTSTDPIREHYLVGPDTTGKPDDYRTEVLWPLAPQ